MKTMKTMKRAFALLLALAVTVGLLSTAAFAAESYPITINNENATATHTYSAYQVFSGTLSTKENGDKVLANIQWGSGVDGAALLTELKASTDSAFTSTFADCTSAADVAKVLENYTDNSAAMEKFADIVGKHLTSTSIASTASADNKTYTINATAPGYYIIKEGINNDTARSASGFMIEVVGPCEMNVKDNPLTPDKNILQNGETKVKEGTANVGDDVQFVVDTITVPSTDGYKTFKFVMKDTLPKGFTFKSIDSVLLEKGNASSALTNDAATNGYSYTVTEGDNGTHVLQIAVKDALTTLKPYEGKEIEIKYTATVNKDAEFGNTGNKNEVVFEYTNNPDDEHTGDTFGPDEPHGTTPKSETTTYVTKIIIEKVDEKNAALSGAVFSLSGSAKNVVVTTGDTFTAADDGTYYLLTDGTYTTTAPTAGTADKYKSTTQKYKLETYDRVELEGKENVDVSAVSGTDGKITFEGLKPGEYTITETGAPVGFNKITDPISVKIKFNTETKKFEYDGEAPAGVTVNADGTFTVKVENKSGATLPSTGGIGTKIFYALGAVLVVGAGVVLVSRKRVTE